MVRPRNPKMMQSRSDAAKPKGRINFTGKGEIFRNAVHPGHGNPTDCHVGICFGEITSWHVGHLLSNRARCRCSLLLPSSLVFVGTCSSRAGETKPKIAYITKDSGKELVNNATIAIELRTPNKKPESIMRKSVSTQAHFNDEVLDRNNWLHVGQGNPPDSHRGICLGEIILPQTGHSLS